MMYFAQGKRRVEPAAALLAKIPKVVFFVPKSPNASCEPGWFASAFLSFRSLLLSDEKWRAIWKE